MDRLFTNATGCGERVFRSTDGEALVLKLFPLSDHRGEKSRPARAAAVLRERKPNGILGIQSVGEIEAGPTSSGYVATPFVKDAMNLCELKKRLRLIDADVTETMVRLTEKVRNLHYAGLVSGAVEPSHVLLADGLDDLIAVLPPGYCGWKTTAFTAPEVLAGREPDERSDIYGIGGTVLFLLTGTTPSLDPGTPTTQLISRHRPDWPDALTKLVEKMLHPCPRLRPQHIDEVLAAIPVRRCGSRFASAPPISVPVKVGSEYWIG